MTEVPAWAFEIPSAPVHQEPPRPQRPLTPQQLREFGSILIEQFIKRIVLALRGYFVPGGGAAFDQLQSWADTLFGNLRDFIGTDPADPGFDLVDAVNDFIDNQLAEIVDGSKITALDASKLFGLIADARVPSLQALRDAILGVGGAPAGSLPFTLPATLGSPNASVWRVFSVLRDFLSFDPGEDGLDLGDAIDAFITTTLASIVDGTKLTALGALRDAIGQAIDGGTGTGYTLALVKSRLENIPSANIVSLAAAKVVGTLADTNIPALAISKITGLAARITHLDGSGQFDATALIGDVADARLPTLAQVRDGLFNGWTGLSLAGVSLPDMQAQASEMSATLSAAWSAIADLQAKDTGGTNSGVSGGDDFERTATTDLGGASYFSQTYSGASTTAKLAIVNGHDAAWVVDSGDDGARSCMARRTATADAVTLDDYQIVSMVIGTQLHDTNVNITGECHNSLYGRVNTAATHYVRAKVERGQASLWYAAGGSEAQLGSPVSTTHAVGVKFDLVCGTSGGLRVFQIRRNGAVILTYTDGAAVTSAGASYRGWGFGMGNAAEVFGNQTVRPSSIARVTVADNTPQAILGTTFRAYRASTSGISNSTGDHVLASGTMDTVDYISPDLTWDSSTQKVTVSSAGTYAFAARYEFTSSMNGAAPWVQGWYKNGSIKARGDRKDGTAVGATAETTVGGQMFVDYLVPGDYVQPSVNTGAARSIVGDAAGTKSWLVAMKIA